MTRLTRFGSVLLLAGLTGCVLPPPVPPPPPPLVALPGPGKTEVQFQADDSACRAAADAAPPSATVTIPAPNGPAASTNAQAATAQPAGPQTLQVTPGMVYLRCMTAHNDIVQPLAPTRPLYYGFYPAYPVYYGFGDVYPWLYGDGFGFGFYGGRGFGYGYGYGGFRGGYFAGDRGFGDRGFGGGGFGGGGGFRR